MFIRILLQSVCEEERESLTCHTAINLYLFLISALSLLPWWSIRELRLKHHLHVNATVCVVRGWLFQG